MYSTPWERVAVAGCVWAVNNAWVIHWTLSCLLQVSPHLHRSPHWDPFITAAIIDSLQSILYCFFFCLFVFFLKTSFIGRRGMIVTWVNCNTSNFSNQEQVINHLINFTHARLSPYSTCENEEPWGRILFFLFLFNFLYCGYGYFCIVVKLIKVKLCLCVCVDIFHASC